MLKTLMERWQTLVREQRDFLDNGYKARLAADPKFDFTKDEAYIARAAEISSLEPQIAALRALDQQERAFDNPGQTRGAGGGDPTQLRAELAPYRQIAQRMARSLGDTGYQPNDEDAQQFRDMHEYLRTGVHPDRFRANLVTTGTTTGGYGVPTMFASQIIHDLPAMESVRRAGAQVVSINGNTNYTTMAKVNGNFIQEAASVTATDPTVGRIQLLPELLICRTIGSWAIFNRFITSIETEIRRAFAMGIAETEGAKFLTGSGSNQPQGLTVGGTSALTAGSATVLTAAEISSLWYALHPMYQGNATWFMNGVTMAEIGVLEDTNGNRIVQPNLTQGFMSLFGRPIINEPLMPNTASGLKPIVCADVAQGYIIGEESGLSMIVDPYTQLGTGETQIAMYKYVDGRVKVAAAVKYITMA